jgi:hypothetical protein
VRGGRPPAWVQAGAVRGRHVDRARLGLAPGVVDDVGAGAAGGVGHRGAIGVDRDDQVGIALPHRLDELDDPADLLVQRHVRAGGGLDSTDVDEVGALANHLVDSVERPFELEGAAAVEEGVRRAVDDRHDQRLVVRQGLATEAHRHSRASR